MKNYRGRKMQQMKRRTQETFAEKIEVHKDFGRVGDSRPETRGDEAQGDGGKNSIPFGDNKSRKTP
jgi:hypothetical protein